MRLLICLILIGSLRGASIEDNVQVHRLDLFQEHRFGSNLVSYYMKISEPLPSNSAKVIQEKNLPVEFINEIAKTSGLKKAVLAMGWGNFHSALESLEVDFENSNHGTVLRVWPFDPATHRRVVKLFSGFLGSEIDIPVWQALNITGIDSSSGSYHNSGYMFLNSIVLGKVIAFVNKNQQSCFLNTIDRMKLFEGDAVSAKIELEIHESSIVLEFKLNFLARDVTINSVFESEKECFQPKTDYESTLTTSSTIKTEPGMNLNGSFYRNILKEAPQLYKMKGQFLSSRRSIQAIQYTTLPFIALQNEMVFEVSNQSNIEADFKLSSVFSANEFPLLSKISIKEKLGASLKSKLLESQRIDPIFELHYSIINFEGVLPPGSSIKILIPFQQVHRNFETVGSDHLIQNIIPSSIIEHRLKGQKEIYTSYLPNIAYKTKNYDTTIVFAVVSIYLVALFLFFGPLTNLRTYLPPLTKKD